VATEAQSGIPIDRFLALVESEVRNERTPVVDLIAVQTKDPFKVLAATILSARTRDEVTAKAAARLFKKAPDARQLAALTEEEIGRLIYPVGFYNNKAKQLAELPAALERFFAGRIPDTVEELTSRRRQENGQSGGQRCLRQASYLRRHPCAPHCQYLGLCADQNAAGDGNGPAGQTAATLLAADQFPAGVLRAGDLQTGGAALRPLPLGRYVPQNRRQPSKNIKKGGAHAKKRRQAVRILENVNGLRAVEKKGFLDIVAELDADILALQEIKAEPGQLPDSLKNIDGYHAFWNPATKKGYAGVCVYSRSEPLRVQTGLGEDDHDGEGRVLTLEYDNFFFVNAYFPNAQHGLTRLDYKLAFNGALLDYLVGLRSKKSVVVCGDFNVAHKPIDLANPKSNEKNPGFTPEERQWMDRFVEAGFIDTFRKFHAEAGQYSWWSYRFNARQKNIGWRIDYFCVDAGSENRVKDASILQEILGSDHCPVSLEFL